MADHHEHSDRRPDRRPDRLGDSQPGRPSGRRPNANDDARFEQLLKSGYAAPEPSAEYQETLLRQLDQAFAEKHQSIHTEGGAALPSITGVLHNGTGVLHNGTGVPHNGQAIVTAVNQRPVVPTDEIAPRQRRGVSLRMALTMATAASLLFVVALWNNQSAYGWASMLRALENCNWVQAASEATDARGWISSERGVMAVRSEGQIAFHDQSKRTSSQYFADRNLIQQQNLATGSVSLGPAQLIGVLLNAGGNDRQVSSEVEVVSESWRHVEGHDDRQASVELRVALKLRGDSEPPVKILFELDPETHLPRSCRLLTSERASSRSYNFSYPAEGPNSIYALGIPRETVVVASLGSDGSKNEENDNLTAPITAASTTDKLAAVDRKTSSNEPAVEILSQAESTQQELTQQATDKAVVAEETVTAPPVEMAADDVAEARVASNPPRRELPVIAFPEQVVTPQELVGQINTQLAASWQSQGMFAAEPASDSEFLRRVYLDLMGRIPMVDEVYRFTEDTAPNRRELLVDELLLSRDHATHLATVWRSLLLPDGIDTATYGGTAKFDEWLADRFAKNLPYDELVSQLLLAEGRVSDSGPILFYAALKLNPEELAAKTARTFLGMRMECAQCHDHPFDESISQQDFWGFAAHFAQISRPQGKMEMTSSVLRVRDNARGEVTLPDSDEVVPPHLPYAVSLDMAPMGPNSAGQAPGRTKQRSRREVLVDWVTTKQNSRFARATVNRAWQHLFGLGLVEPVDDMRADNPAICPEVLDTLSLDFAASDYDLRRLLRTLVLSDAYQLSSRAATDEPSQGLAFARMNIKSLTADQLYDCISVATEFETPQNRNAEEGALSRIGNRSRQAFIEQFRAPPGQRTDYHAGIPQALTLMHGYLIHGATDLSSSGLLKSLDAPFFTNEQRIETLFLATLSRYPEPAEQEKMLEYVEAASSDAERSSALGDILWALLNSAEFTFIH